MTLLLAIGCSSHVASSEQTGELSSAVHGGAAVSPSTWSNVVALDETCSGVLLAADLVVFAAHCGPFVAVARGNGQEVATERCAVYPKGMPGGTDLAYCLLERKFADSELIFPALGCEVDAIVEGAPVTLVGYGHATEQDLFGTLRVATSRVETISKEIMVRSEVVGTCAGDSGGPAFVEVPDSGGGSLRLAGVLSGAETRACEAGPSYYTPLWPFVGWLETETGIDISPCGAADGSWSPTSACVAVSRPQGQVEPGAYSASCGSPFDETRSGEAQSPAACHVGQTIGSRAPWWPNLVAMLLALASFESRRSRR